MRQLTKSFATSEANAQFLRAIGTQTNDPLLLRAADEMDQRVHEHRTGEQDRSQEAGGYRPQDIQRLFAEDSPGPGGGDAVDAHTPEGAIAALAEAVERALAGVPTVSVLRREAPQDLCFGCGRPDCAECF